MVAPVAKTSRMRQRKLNLKQPLQVVREDDLESFEANEPTLKEIQTGVEAHEEQEHHLQAVISAAQAAASGGSAAKASIPTRGTDASDLPYETYYSLKFAQPATYIRFSSTVEDCIDGAAYDMIEEDDDFLRTLNEGLRTQAQQASSRPTSRSAAAANESMPRNCSDSQFETEIAAFEAAAKAAAPFSNSVTGDQAAPILSIDEQILRLPDHLSEETSASSSNPSSSKPLSFFKALVPSIYPYWQSRRSQNGNTSLTPALKVKVLETGDALDDNDPYVCFRRREVRAVRKTRGRDAQSSEKLRLLRRQLEDARLLLQTVLGREKQRRDVLSAGRNLFDARSNLRSLKRTLPSQFQEGDDDLLVDQKPKKRPPEPAPIPRPNVPPSVPVDAPRAPPDLQLLDEWYEARRRQQLTEITTKVHQHKQWNLGYIDDTTTPIKPLPPDDGTVGGFRAARTEYLPTPPASSASGDSPVRMGLIDEKRNRFHSDDRMQLDGQIDGQQDKPSHPGGMTASPPEDSTPGQLTSFPTTGANTPAALIDGASQIAKMNDLAVAKTAKQQPVHVRYAAPSSLRGPVTGRSPSFRRRIGRGGRVWIDRRHMSRAITPDEDASESESEFSGGLKPLLQERFRFDHDSDDDADDDPSYVHREEVDPYDWRSMYLRAQNCPMNANTGSHSAALAQHNAQLQKQRYLQLQAQAQAQQAQIQGQHQSQAYPVANGAGNGGTGGTVGGGGSSNGSSGGTTLQTLRQQVAAAQQAAAAQAAANVQK